MSINPPQIELLAPAGSTDCFQAAINAGADAVYLGCNEFNARLRARNFSMRALAYLVPYAHSREVKVYLTLNTLVKQQELEHAVDLLHQAQQIGIDAVIMQDLGIVRIMRDHFPSLRVHASTQMVIHNSAGVKAAEKLGIRRIILSRELSLDEIAAIRKSTRTELEVFVHGALCYSISGACLASSFIGGASGNRGRCTQVCRRKFSSDQGSGYFFSCRDLSAIELVPRFIDLGITSLKIEGRMKSAEYIHTVVSAYRSAIDNPDTIPDCIARLRLDLSRKKTTLFLSGPGERIIDPSQGAGIGVQLGEVKMISGTTIGVDTAEPIAPGDVVRVQPREGFEGRNAKVLSMERDDTGVLLLVLNNTDGVKSGDLVFLTSRKEVAGKLKNERKVDTKPAFYRQHHPRSRAIVASYRIETENSQAEKDELIVKIDSPAWIPLLDRRTCDRLIVDFEADDLRRTIVNDRIVQSWRDRLSIALPLFIPERDLATWRELIGACRQRGISRFFAGNLCGKELLGDATAWSDFPLWCLNRAAQKATLDMGYSGFSFSVEDDAPNLKATGSSRGMAYLFGRVPLFVSRIATDLPPGTSLSDPHDNRFITARRHGLHYLLPEKPFCLTHKREALREFGIRKFVLDFSFFAPDRGLVEKVIERYYKQEKVEGSPGFNFRLGLR